MFGFNPAAIGEAMEKIGQYGELIGEAVQLIREIRQDQERQADELVNLRAEIRRLCGEGE